MAADITADRAWCPISSPPAIGQRVEVRHDQADIGPTMVTFTASGWACNEAFIRSRTMQMWFDPTHWRPIADLSGEANVCAASPDHADILETIENAGPEWQAQGYTSALAEVRDMANVGRSLIEAIASVVQCGPMKGWTPCDGPAEIVADLHRHLDDALDDAETLTARLAQAEGENRAADYRIRRMAAALRVGRGYVLGSATAQAGRDLVTIEAALAGPQAGGRDHSEDLRDMVPPTSHISSEK